VRDRLSVLNSGAASPQGNVRLLLLRIAAMVMFALLLVQVWRLQIVKGQQYSELADRVRFREIELPAQRGVIYDRDGEILVRNIPSFVVSIVPADLPDDEDKVRAIVTRLVDLLDLTDETWLVPPFAPTNLSEVERDHWEARALASSLRKQASQQPPVDFIMGQIADVEDLAPFRPLVIKTGVDRELAFILEEEHLNLPGVRIDVESLRQYPTAELTSHLLGYVGPIPSSEVEDYEAKGYLPSDRVGLTGIELEYEDTLHGTKGLKHIEVDVAGREVRTIGEITPPIPGKNLVLALDLDLQATVENALRKGLKQSRQDSGVAIVMDPNTGDILAMVSLPTYDNNLFTDGISWREYERLSSDKRRPLLNHAISGQYPPGSVFKIVPASAALQEGVIDERTLVTCEGIMFLPNQYFPDDLSKAQKFYCWIHKYGKHGPMNLTEGLAQSCDIFFYVIGGGFGDFAGLGLETMAYYARQFGFGSRSGIDLPGETTGLIPSARWKRLNYAESWVTGDTYNMAIGQGFVLSNPLQMLNATAAVANNGILYRPHLVKQITDQEGNVIQTIEPVVVRQLPLAEETLFSVQNGLAAAVDHGTAQRVGLAGITVAGKTGTAEFAGPRDSGGNLPTHAWFTAYAPFENPEIAVVVFVFNGGEGSKVAAPIAAEILSAYFDAPLLYTED